MAGAGHVQTLGETLHSQVRQQHPRSQEKPNPQSRREVGSTAHLTMFPYFFMQYPSAIRDIPFHALLVM
ncbi:MAG: hypothetical protein L7H08_02940 [Vulcanisaeta sp.]|nr:hypothetical protein [Vulcanisaeta sp.]